MLNVPSLKERDGERPEELDFCAEGIWLRRDKTKGEVSGALITSRTWRLCAVVERLLALRAERKLKKRAAQRVETPALIRSNTARP